MNRLLFHTASLALALLLLAGCASTEERFEKAQTLEEQGRYAEAAEYYIKVLESEPDWEGARAGLLEAGALAVERYLDEAAVAEQRDDYDEAFRLLDRLDDLRDDADDVGVLLTVPEDYAGYRAQIRDAAIDMHLRRGEAAEANGDWSRALQAYERGAAYATEPRQEDAFNERQARVLIKWGETDADRAAFQAAFGRAQQAIDLVGPDHPLARRAADLQYAALDAGTHFVAFLPLWRTEDVDRSAPETLLEDVNDVLLYEYWSAPPPFIAAADPVELRRELRRLRYDRRVITRTEAAEIGRVVDADFVVVGEMTDFAREERNVKDRTRTATLKGRGSTLEGPKEVQWIERRATLDLEAGVEYRIIDPRSRREVDRGTVSASVSGRVQRGVYAGDYRDLDLSGSELSLFEEEERQAVQALTNELADALAARLAERVHRDLLHRIP